MRFFLFSCLIFVSFSSAAQLKKRSFELTAGVSLPYFTEDRNNKADVEFEPAGLLQFTYTQQFSSNIALQTSLLHFAGSYYRRNLSSEHLHFYEEGWYSHTSALIGMQHSLWSGSSFGFDLSYQLGLSFEQDERDFYFFDAQTESVYLEPNQVQRVYSSFLMATPVWYELSTDFSILLKPAIMATDVLGGIRSLAGANTRKLGDDIHVSAQIGLAYTF